MHRRLRWFSGTARGDRDHLAAGGDPDLCAFEELGRVLGTGGLDFSHILEMTPFQVDMAARSGIFREVRDLDMSEPWTAWPVIGTTELAVPGPRLETKVTCSASEPDR